MNKLTEEDCDWLESRLSDAATDPILPRPDFVTRAHDELMDLHVEPPRRVRPGVLIAVIFSMCGLISALLLIGQRRRTAA